jgi:CRISPR type III-A-associated protein Csm2
VPPPPKLIDNGKPRLVAFDQEAQAWAEALLTPPKREPKLNTTQLRNFFHNMKEILAEAQADREGDFSLQLLRIRMLKSQVAYAVGRGNAPSSFKKLIDHLVGQVQDLESYELACRFMEAVVGYFVWLDKAKGAKKGRGR